MPTEGHPLENPFDDVMARVRYRHVRFPDSVAEADIRTFERDVGYSLPPNYRLFLMKYGLAAGKGDTKFTSPGNSGEPETSVDVFYGFKAGDMYDIRDNWQRYSEELPAHLLSIACGSGGQFLLSLNGEDKGVVYWWFPETGPVESTDDLEPVSDSFDQFVNSLVSVER